MAAEALGPRRSSRIPAPTNTTTTPRPRSRARAPLSSVDSNVVRKGTTRTTREFEKISNRKVDGSKIKSTTKKKQSKIKSRRRSEIYSPLVVNRSTQSKRSHDIANSAPNQSPQSLSIVQSGIQTLYNYTGDETFQSPPREIVGQSEASKNANLRVNFAESPASVPVVHFGANVQPPVQTFFYSRGNITHDAQQWEDEQCATFKSWINKLFQPKKDISPGDEVNRSTEWKTARNLFDSPKMQAIRCSVEREVKEGRLTITPGSNRNMIDQVYVQEQLTKLLLSYSPRWLQLGLGVVLAMKDDLNFETKNQMTKDSLKKIIMQRVLSEPSVVQKYTGGRCKTPSGKYESKLRTTIHQHALSQIMTLVFFLDVAKTNHVLTEDPCLFQKSSSMKSSEEVLISLVQDCFSKQGSIINHLKHEGTSASHVQNPLDEYGFYVKNLAVDLKDGICLARMIDIVTNRPDLLSSMRIPADTRQHKIYNVKLSLSALRHLGVRNISDITTAHVVNAHQPRILQLLWSTILHFELPEFRQEIIHYKASRLIQTHARRFLWMKSYQLAHRGVVLFQSVHRGFILRAKARRKNAASEIQKMWRGYSAKLSYGFDLMDIITTQSICRRFIAQKNVAEKSRRMNVASAEIQRIWRGYYARINYGCDLMAIITAQSICRRFLAQDRVVKLSKNMNNLAVAIQKLWRGYCAKINYQYNSNGIVTVQSVCRRILAQDRVARMANSMSDASVKIQRIWRGYSAQLLYGFDLMGIIMVQSIGRRLVASNAVARRHTSTLKIQSTVRMWAAKRLYHNSIRCICTIQGHIRRALALIRARDLKSHAGEQDTFVSDEMAQRAAYIQPSPRHIHLCQESLRTKHAALRKTKFTDEREQLSGAIADTNTPGSHPPLKLRYPKFISSSSRKALAMPICPGGEVRRPADKKEEELSDNVVANCSKSSHSRLKARSPPNLSNIKASVNVPRNPLIAKTTEVTDSSEQVASGAWLTNNFNDISIRENNTTFSSTSEASEDAEEILFPTKHKSRIRSIYPVEKFTRLAEYVSNVNELPSIESNVPNATAPIPSFSLTHGASVLQDDRKDISFCTMHESGSSSVDSNMPTATSPQFYASLTKKSSMLQEDAAEISVSLKHAPRRQALFPFGQITGVTGEEDEQTRNITDDTDNTSIDSNMPKVISSNPSVSLNQNSSVLKGGGEETFFLTKHESGRRESSIEETARIEEAKEEKVSSTVTPPRIGYSSSTPKGSLVQEDAEEISVATSKSEQITGVTGEVEQVRHVGGGTNNSFIDCNMPNVTRPSNTSASHGDAEEKFFLSKCASRRRELHPFGKIGQPNDELEKLARGDGVGMHEVDNDMLSIQSSPKLHHYGMCHLESTHGDSELDAGGGEEVIFTTKHAHRRQNGTVMKISDKTGQSGNRARATDESNIISTLASASSFSKEEAASVLIQNMWRRYTISKPFIALKQKQLILEKAAEKISSSTRNQAKEIASLTHGVIMHKYYRKLRVQSATTDLKCLMELQQNQSAAIDQTDFRHYACHPQYDTLKTGLLPLRVQTRSFVPRTDARLTRNAATIIQCAFRRHIIANHYHSLQKSAVLAQAFCRGRKARRETAVRLHQIKVLQRTGCGLERSFELRWTQFSAAVQIQRTWRGYLANVDFMLLLLATIKIQSFVRVHIATVKYRHVVKGVARMQAYFREMKAKRKSIHVLQQFGRRILANVKTHRVLSAVATLQRAARVMLTSMHAEVDFAATQIQRAWRGYQANKAFVLINTSATTIQTEVRCKCASRVFATQRKAISTIQRAARVMLAGIHNEVHCYAATEIQRVWRGYIANVDFMHLFISSIKIQAIVRGQQTRLVTATRLKSIRVLQSVCRKYLAKLKIGQVLAAVATLQRAARAMITTMHDEVDCFAATQIQRAWRGYQANKAFVLINTSATRIQSAVRGRLASQDFATQRKAISTIQRAARVMLAGIHSEVHCYAATEIQRVWRGYEANMDFMLMVISSIKIQAIVRGQQTRLVTATQLRSIRAIQRVGRVFLENQANRRAVARMRIARANSEVEFCAARTIQRIWRGYMASTDFMLIVISAITIQSFVRLTGEKLAKERLKVKVEKERIEREQSSAEMRLAAKVYKKRIERGQSLADERLVSSTLRLKIRTEGNTAVMKNVQRGSVSKDNFVNSVQSVKARHNDGTPKSKPGYSRSKVKSAARLSEASPPAQPMQQVMLPQVAHTRSAKFKKHTTNAIRTVETSKKFGEVLKAIITLEKITQRSMEDCKLVVEADVQRKMFSIIHSCNRSSPHVKVKVKVKSDVKFKVKVEAKVNIKIKVKVKSDVKFKVRVTAKSKVKSLSNLI